MTIGLTTPHKIKDMVELYSSKNKPSYPDFLKKIHNWGTPPYQGKYRSIAIYESPNDKLYEAMIALTKRYNFYASEGHFTFEIIPLMSEADAMKVALGK